MGKITCCIFLLGAILLLNGCTADSIQEKWYLDEINAAASQEKAALRPPAALEITEASVSEVRVLIPDKLHIETAPLTQADVELCRERMFLLFDNPFSLSADHFRVTMSGEKEEWVQNAYFMGKELWLEQKGMAILRFTGKPDASAGDLLGDWSFAGVAAISLAFSSSEEWLEETFAGHILHISKDAVTESVPLIRAGYEQTEKMLSEPEQEQWRKQWGMEQASDAVRQISLVEKADESKKVRTPGKVTLYQAGNALWYKREDSLFKLKR